MSQTSTWLLPEHLADILPNKAQYLEQLRRQVLNLFQSWGYEYVMPPLLEYTDSLLANQSSDLNIRTMKLVDQLSGKSMGIRADMTPQIMRIDAHLLNRNNVARLCYCGSVVHARPSNALSDRELLQIGAEIYGYKGIEADIEIIRLAMASLHLALQQQVRVDITHPGVSKALINFVPELHAHTSKIFRLLSEKNTPDLKELLKKWPNIPQMISEALCVLPSLQGGSEVIHIARERLPKLPGIKESLDQLEIVVNALPKDTTIDLADVGGYDYHNGVSFSLFAPNWHDALARGGRYDFAGKAFGRERAATGFSLDLRRLALSAWPEPTPAILAPWSDDESLQKLITDLRNQGKIVVQVLPNSHQSPDEFVFTSKIEYSSGQWTIQPL